MRILLSLYLLLLFYTGLSAQGITDFGPNRVNGKQQPWMKLTSEDVEVYFYGNNEQLAQFVFDHAKYLIESVENKIDSKMSDKVHVILYASEADFRESNFSYRLGQMNTGGYIYVVETQVAAVYNGNIHDFITGIKRGIAEVLLSDIMYGGSIQERAQAATLLFLPEWYFKGLCDYIAEPWSVELDNELRNLYLSGKLRQFNWLSNREAEIAGHGLWRFLDSGRRSRRVSDLIYFTRASRNFDAALAYSTGKNASQLIDDWLRYLGTQYTNNNPGGLRSHALPAENTYADVAANPHNRKVAITYTENEVWKIALFDKKEGLRTLVHKGSRVDEQRRLFQNKPLMKWTSDGRYLQVIDRRKDTYYLFEYDSKQKLKRKIPIEGPLDYIQSFTAYREGWIIAAVSNGVSDLYSFEPNSDLTTITSDLYDDADPYYDDSTQRIYFASNRNDFGIKKSNSFDLFYMLPNEPHKGAFSLTRTPGVNERNMFPYAQGRYTFSSDITGIVNQFIFKPDTLNFTNRFTPLTSFGSSVISASYSDHTSTEYYLVKQGAATNLYETEALEDLSEAVNMEDVPVSTYKQNLRLPVDYNAFVEKKQDEQQAVPSVDTVAIQQTDSNAVNTPSVAPKRYFLPDVSVVPGREYRKVAGEDSVTKEEQHTRDKYRPFRTALFPEYLVTQFDNSVLGTFYYRQDGFSDAMATYDVLAHLRFGLTDLMGNQKITAGLRLPFSFSGSDVYVLYNYLKWKADIAVEYYRLSRRSDNTNFYRRLNTQLFNFRVSYPITENLRWSNTASYRQDRSIVLGTDSVTLDRADDVNNILDYTTELIYDNTTKLDINLPVGTRVRLYGEFMRYMDNLSKGAFIWGIDVRKYVQVHKKMVWANRFTFNASSGSNPVLFFIGGVENWLGRSFDGKTRYSDDPKYDYRMYANSVRGFKNNIRSGQNYFIFSSELRFPVAMYVSKKPVRMDFLRNFLLVAFTDLATAWTGPVPIGEQPYNTRYVAGGSTNISVVNLYNPLVAAWGIGARSRVFSYYLKLDIAWPYAESTIRNTFTTVSLGLDF